MEKKRYKSDNHDKGQNSAPAERAEVGKAVQKITDIVKVEMVHGKRGGA